jgi:hypothetical protein
MIDLALKFQKAIDEEAHHYGVSNETMEVLQRLAYLVANELDDYMSNNVPKEEN